MFNCPTSPPNFQGATGTQLTVAVNVQNSPAFNGFDVQVLTDPSILQPVSDSLSGSVLQNPFVARNSVNSTSGLVNVAATSSVVTTPPTTGRFFSITYNIVGTTQGSFVLFPVRCSNSSNDSICVTVVNGANGGAVVPEDIQEANFTSSSPDFSLSASPSSLSITKSSSATVGISATSLSGFSGTVSLSLSITPNLKRGPVLSLGQTTLTLTPGGTASTSLAISTNGGTLPGTYTITITGKSGTITHTTTVVVTIVAKH